MATKTAPVSFYLGDKEKRDQRMEHLEQLAGRFDTTRSVLLQKIADGELVVVPAETVHRRGSGSLLMARAGTWEATPEDVDQMETAIEERFEQLDAGE